MLGRVGFFAEIEVDLRDGGMMRLGTDDSWRVKPAEAWERNLPRMSIQLGYPEVFDARKEITGWADAGFDDSNWETESMLGPAGMEPWPGFVPREIPAMMETPMQAECVIDTGEVGPVSTGHYVDILRVVWNTAHGVAYLATFVWSPLFGFVLNAAIARFGQDDRKLQQNFTGYLGALDVEMKAATAGVSGPQDDAGQLHDDGANSDRQAQLTAGADL